MVTGLAAPGNQVLPSSPATPAVTTRAAAGSCGGRSSILSWPVDCVSLPTASRLRTTKGMGASEPTACTARGTAKS